MHYNINKYYLDKLLNRIRVSRGCLYLVIIPDGSQCTGYIEKLSGCR